MKNNTILFIGLIFFSSDIFSQEKSKDFYITKGKGYEFHFFDNNYLLQIDFRGQFRASYPYDNFPKESSDFNDEDTNLGISRARIKIGGYVYRSFYTFYFEQDIKGANLLDFRAQIEKLSYLKLRVGQWKVRYSRERVISSGKQQGLDRSMINRIFTVDRQQGVSIYGNLKGRKLVNFNYWLSALTGTGRGGGSNDDENLMYMLRLQWNPNEEVLAFSGSDLKFHEKFTSSLAIAGVTNTSPYTAFSTSGGGQLAGFEPGIEGQYKINQFMFETAFKLKGFSWQQELHYKNIDDTINLERTTLIGNYFQFGYFFHHILPKFPKHLEIFARQSFYDANIDLPDNNNYEYTIGCNWFFKGHKNKLTIDYSYIEYHEFEPIYNSGNRIRLQWDISIF